MIRRRSSVSAPITSGHIPGFTRGLTAGVCCIVLGLSITIVATDNSTLRMLSVLVLPFLVSLVLTRNVVDALTLTWASEIFAGGAGDWAVLGPFSGRWLLLIVTVVSFALLALGRRSHVVKSTSRSTRLVSAWVMFLGIVLPAWLVMYAVLGRGVAVSRALSDVTLFVALLMYFPMLSAGPRSRRILLGWIVGGTGVLVCLFLAMAFGPREFPMAVFDALSPGSVFGVTETEINRAVLLPMALLPFPIFICAFYVIDSTITPPWRLAACALGFLSLLPFLAMWVRGPLVAIALVLVLIIVAMVRAGRAVSHLLRMGALLSLVIVGAAVTMDVLVPEQFRNQFLGRDAGLFDTWLDVDRMEQAQVMFDALKQEPFLGQGVGAGIAGYSRGGDDPLAMELEYNKMLYRLGIVGFLTLILPLAWLFLEPFRLFRDRRLVMGDQDAKFLLAALGTTLAILIMASTNPYLKTPYTALMIVLYLQLRGRPLQGAVGSGA